MSRTACSLYLIGLYKDAATLSSGQVLLCSATSLQEAKVTQDLCQGHCHLLGEVLPLEQSRY